MPRIRQKATPVINERLNYAIKKEQLLVIDPTGHKHGPMLKADALALAKDHGLDLYLVSEPKEGVAVAKILNYGRVHYNKIKKAKALKKQQAVIHNREIRFRVRIAEHDQKVKIKKIQEFLEAQQRVKISLRFRGREAAHPELGFAKINEIIEAVATWGTRDGSVSRSGMVLSCWLVPIKTKLKKSRKSTSQTLIKGKNYAKNEN